MKSSPLRLRERRAALVLLAAEQRRILGCGVDRLRTPLAQIDQGIVALRFVRKHALWIAGGLVTLTALRPGLVGRWLGRGWLAARIVGKLRGGN